MNSQASNTLTYTLKPSISTVSPSSGSGGDVITVSGASFGGTQGASTLTLGASTLTPDAWSANAVTFTVTSAMTAGAANLVVTVNSQASNRMMKSTMKMMNRILAIHADVTAMPAKPKIAATIAITVRVPVPRSWDPSSIETDESGLMVRRVKEKPV